MINTKTIRGRAADRDMALTIEYTNAGVISIDEDQLRPGEVLPIIAPGFIDVQVNGYAGMDINGGELSVQTVLDLTDRLARGGVTTWMPTIITASEEHIRHALDVISQARIGDAVARAAIPSVHIEGPFISDLEGARGVHDATAIRPLDADEVTRWQRSGPVGLITVSPHTPDAPAHIARIRALGVSVAIGHTHATPEQITRAVDAGAAFSTHLGNGIPSLLPRHPNAIWTQLADDRLSAGLIADGHHLPMETLEVMLRAKPVGRSFLVSDLTAIGGSPPGRYKTPVGGTVELDATNRLSYAGTDLLAGAASTIADGLRNVIAGTSQTLATALPLVTSSPARAATGGRPGLGYLRPGSPADFVLLSPSGPTAGTVVGVVQGGRKLEGKTYE
ncbi:N-acetylglucosamine-6-phosphate deacetylase [Arthrobacter sp. 4R501]|uniref:N-acetylglucosamine-6-phosphate deacetylase n=1 Tax=Arthrobacter sp. 4R501 TaxID=2058886 RepID=UPI000CE403AF|nr:amidohydrolase family protein [Arthrobacter sp. 4R501]